MGEDFIHVQFIGLKFYGNILQMWTFMDLFYEWEFYGLKINGEIKYGSFPLNLTHFLVKKCICPQDKYSTSEIFPH
jgi:hypothetical protein